jgi:large subunit ribosomal protein L5
MNIMREIRIEKVTLNIGCGKDQTKLDKAVKLLKSITGIDPVKTFAKKRIPEWGLRPGLPIGCKITLRKKAASDLLLRLLKAKSFKLMPRHFNDLGNISFGIEEYIDIPDVKYDPEVGIIGLEACVTLERRGFRIKRRKICKKKLPKSENITTPESVEFMQKNFNVKMGEEE